MPSDPSADTSHLPLDDAPLAFVDVETTGLNAWSGDRICEVAVVRYQGTREVGRVVTLVNPLRAISPGAFAVNGITPAMVAGAPTFARIAAEVREALEGAVLVAHNAPFDLGFLGRELALAGEPAPSSPVCDTLALARRNYRFRSNSLGAIAAALGIWSPEHRALADALVTREVFYRFVRHLYPGGALVSDVLWSQGGSVPWPVVKALPALPPRLVEAVQSRQSLRLWYVSADGRQTVRWVDPISLTGWEGTLSLVAYCHLRQEQRTFRLDRIVHWESGTPPALDTNVSTEGI